VVRLLLAGGAGIDGGDDDGVTPLMAAARQGHTGTLEYLLSSGARVDARNRWGMTALHYAATNGYPDIVERLLEAGASPHARTIKGGTPLLNCTVPAIAEALLRAGADPNARTERTTPLHVAATSIGGRGYSGTQHREGEPRDRLGMARVLLAAGAAVDARDASGRTPLVALLAGRGLMNEVPLVRLLLRNGADPDARDPEGRTGLRLVADSWRRGWIPRARQAAVDVANGLLAAGAVDAPGPDGRTALEVALQKKAEPLVEVLQAAR